MLIAYSSVCIFLEALDLANGRLGSMRRASIGFLRRTLLHLPFGDLAICALVAAPALSRPAKTFDPDLGVNTMESTVRGAFSSKVNERSA